MAGDRDVDSGAGVRLRAADVRHCAREALVALGRAREEIDALNVFPVADSDTGTNLYLTMEAAVQAAEALPDDADAAACLTALARGSLTGAWGNSGVILAQMIRGAAAALVELEGGTGADLLAAALRRATELAYAAVDRPTEGTMLTVLRVAADAATGDDLVLAAGRAVAAAEQALELTPLQLEVLARAGVVDAGGRGLTVLLDVLATEVSGVTRMTPPPRARLPVPNLPAAGCETSNAGFELMFLFDGDAGAAARLRADLANLGDSLVVVGGEDLWNVHLHTDDCGAALEVAVRFGRPHGIRMTTLASPPPQPTGEQRRGRAVLALAAGPGLAKLLDEAGAAVLEVAPGVVPATAALLEALRRPDAAEVVLLPNDRDGHAACEAAAAQARHAGITVSVLPTSASVQALAALAVHDPGRRFAEDVVAMTAAATATRHAAVLLAPTDAVTSAGVCSAGDALGLIDDDVVLIGSDPEVVGAELIERLLGGGGELLTLIAGHRLDPEATHRLAETLRRTRPDVECIAFDGGQADYPLLLGVE